MLTTVGTADADASRQTLSAPTLIVIGEVVRLAEVLDWFVPDGQDFGEQGLAGQQGA